MIDVHIERAKDSSSNFQAYVDAPRDIRIGVRKIGDEITLGSYGWDENLEYAENYLEALTEAIKIARGAK